MPKLKCAYCDQDAEKFCDFCVSIIASEKSRYFTCDTPLCRRCASVQGIEFIKTRTSSYADTRDFCPIHENPKDVFAGVPIRPLLFPDADTLARHGLEVLQWRENHKAAIDAYRKRPGEAKS